MSGADREAVAAWLRFGEGAHARIPVIGLRRVTPRDGAGPPRTEPAAQSRPVDDDVFVPLYVHSVGGRDGGRSGPHDGQTRVTIEQALDYASWRGPARMVLLGDPGSGKTTLLRHLFGRLAREGAAVPAPLAGLHPVWISLSTLSEAELAAEDLGPVVRRVAHEERHGTAGEVVLRGPVRLLVLLDGLDEIRDEAMRAQALALLARAVARWPRSAFVLTSRLTQWEGLQATPERDHFASQFLAVRVAPMDPGTQAEYVRTWWRETERARDRLRDAAVIAAAAEVRAAPLLEALRKAREGTPHRAQMFANPLMLSMLCALDAAGEPQPERPAALYEAVLRLLIENWQRPAGKKLPLDEARVVLEPLAYGSQAGAGRALRYEEAVAIVERPLADTRELRRVTPTAGDLLAVMRKDCGIFTGDDPGYVEFLHLQLREYLAAGHVQRQQLGHALAARLGTADEAHWKETMLLAMQMPGVSGPFLAAVLERGTLGPSRAVVRECVVEAGAQLDAGPITRAIDAALAGHAGEVEAWRGVAVAERLEELFALVDGLELEGMAERRRDYERRWGRVVTEGWDWVAGQAMRLPINGMVFRWIEPGQFTMGSTDEDELAFGNEKPAHPVTITRGYWMGEHPVTNRQYRAFVEATGHRAPKFWGDRRYSDPAQPVVGVSWDDAQAYCGWVNEQVPARTGVQFRLPTEAEWEYAARGRDGRRYPWGSEEPDARRATYGLDLETGKPSPVGMHPAGASPFWLHDMAGNVWEWCSDVGLRRYPAGPEIDPVSPGEGPNRVNRGGSWYSHARYVRAAYRYAYPREDRYDNLGFRLAGGQAANQPAS